MFLGLNLLCPFTAFLVLDGGPGLFIVIKKLWCAALCWEGPAVGGLLKCLVRSTDRKRVGGTRQRC